MLNATQLINVALANWRPWSDRRHDMTDDAVLDETRQPARRKLLQVLGPGLITGASDDDPSGIATYSQVGAQFGYGRAWTLVFQLPADGGDPGDRARHRLRHRRQSAPALSGVAVGGIVLLLLSSKVGRRFRCTMRIDCGQLDPGAVIRSVPGEWHPRMPERLDEEELADWRTGRNAVYQLAALTIGAPRGRRRISRA
jgi:hypothetical protein